MSERPSPTSSVPAGGHPPATAPAMAPSADDFRAVMSRFATGVTVVSAHHQGRDRGMTVNAFLSVSLEPPTVVISLSSHADTTPLVEASGHFAVSILSDRQRHISELFSSKVPSEQRFEGLAFHRGITGAAMLDGALATMECEVVHRVRYSTHVLLFGRVVALGEVREGSPLLFFRSGYVRPSQGGGLVKSAPRPSGPHTRRPAPSRRPRRRKHA